MIIIIPITPITMYIRLLLEPDDWVCSENPAGKFPELREDENPIAEPEVRFTCF
jgi:hypothetical protein